MPFVIAEPPNTVPIGFQVRGFARRQHKVIMGEFAAERCIREHVVEVYNCGPVRLSVVFEEIGDPNTEEDDLFVRVTAYAQVFESGGWYVFAQASTQREMQRQFFDGLYWFEDYDLKCEFRLSLSLDFRIMGNLQYNRLATPCYCNIPCPELWCEYVRDKTPCWMPTQGLIAWRELANDVECTIELMGDDFPSASTTGVYPMSRGGAYYDTIVKISYQATRTHFDDDVHFGMGDAVGEVDVYRDYLPPQWHSHTYNSQENNEPVFTIGGQELTIYSNFKADDFYNNVVLYDFLGPCGDLLSGSAKTIDGFGIGALLEIPQCVPQPVYDTDGYLVEWSCDGPTQFNDLCELSYQGYYIVSSYIPLTMGPYLTRDMEVLVRSAPAQFEVPGVPRPLKALGPVRVVNIEAIDQPHFPCHHSEHPHECGCTDYADVRVLLRWDTVGLYLPETIYITGKQSTFDVINWTYSDLANWILSDPSHFTITSENGKIKLRCNNSNGWILRYYPKNDYPDLIFLSRYLQVSVDGKPLTVEIAGRQYKTNKLVDTLAPLNAPSTAGVTQSLAPYVQPEARVESETDCPWDWGIYRPWYIKFSGFVAGEDYVLDKITLTQTLNARPRITLLPQAWWVGYQPSDKRNPEFEPFPFAWAGEGGTDTAPAKTWYVRSGIITLDGMVCAEIIGKKEIYTWTNYACDGPGWRWTEEMTRLDSDYLVFPRFEHPFFKVQLSGYQYPENGWGGYHCEAMYLNPVTYGWAPAPGNIRGALRVDYLFVDWSDFRSITLEKFYNAILFARVADPQARLIRRQVRVKTTDGVELWRGYTDETGVIVSHASFFGVNQSRSLKQTPNRHKYIFEVLDGDGGEVEFEVRSRGVTIITIASTSPDEAVAHISGDSEPAVRKYRAFTQGNNVMMQYSDDFGRTWHPESPRVVGTGKTPAICTTRAGRYQQLIVIYDYNGSLVKTISINEGEDWIDLVTLCTGKCPFVVTDPATDFRLLFYFNDGKLWVRRSDDNFASWLKPDGTRVSTTPIKSDAEVASEVASDAAEETVYAEWTGEPSHKVMLVYRNKSNQLVTVFSAANGLPPFA